MLKCKPFSSSTYASQPMSLLYTRAVMSQVNSTQPPPLPLQLVLNVVSVSA